MTNILELLKNEKVEWKKLGEVVEILDSKRKPIKKSDRILGNYPYYGANGIQDYVNDYIFDGTFILMGEDGSVMNKNFTPILHWIENNKIWVNNHAHVLGNFSYCYNLKYIYYYLTTINVSGIVKGTPPKINQANMRNIEIPIPSPEIQEKVVEILDKFTGYVTELQSELQSRTKQYTYYRDMLLSEEYLNKITKEMEEDKNLNLVKLEEIANYCDGTHQTPKYQEKGIPFVSVENIKDLYGTKKYISEDDYKKYKYTPEEDDIFMTRIGDIGTCSVVQDNRDLAYYVTLALIKPNREIVDSKYLKLYIESSYGKRELNKRILHHATPIKVNLGDIGKIKVLIPPLHVQQYIVSILDKFDTLVNDIKEGLPKEIEQRQKQYEYWREQLLSFSK